MSQSLVRSSPIVVLSSLLERMDLPLEVQELADILWLAVQLNQTSSSTELKSSEQVPPGQESASFPVSNSLPPLSKPPVESEPQAAVYASDSGLPSLEGSEPFSMLPYRAPAVSALPHKLDLGRALRPLMRKAFSQTTMELDEETTAVQIAEEKLWIPALQPALERWLDLMIVVEETASFLIWQETILEFQQLMERHGAFRDVRCWRLQVDQTGTLQLFLGKQASANQRPRSYKELLDPTRRRLILVVSDCVFPAWRSGKMKTLLDQWMSQNSVSVLQMLPERLWERSALGIGISTQFRSYTPGVSNSRLENNPIPLWLEIDERTQLKLPVVTLEPEPLKHWARVVAGMGQAQTPGILLDDNLIGSQLNLLTELEQPPLTAEARVARFWATASPTARQLAGLMASVPISLPVVRLIQHKLLPESGSVHLAEVLMSGLMHFDGARGSNNQPDSLPYDFIPGVRELLIDSTPISRTCNVLEQLSKFLEEKTGTALRGFTAFLAPDLSWDASVHEEIQPFARVTRQVLQRLGGDYAKLAEQLSPVKEASCSDPNQVGKAVNAFLTEWLSLPLDYKGTVMVSVIYENPAIKYKEIVEKYLKLPKYNEKRAADDFHDFTKKLSKAIYRASGKTVKVSKSRLKEIIDDHILNISVSENVKLKLETDSFASNQTTTQQHLMFKFADVEAAVNQLLEQRRSRQLNDIESNVLQGICDGQSYQEMGERFNWSSNSLKQTAYKLWSPLSEALHTKVSKSNFRNVMQSYLIRENNVPTESEVAVSLDKLERTLQSSPNQPRVIPAKVPEPSTSSDLERGMYADDLGDFFTNRPEKPEEIEIYDYIRQLARKPSSEAIAAFYEFFFQGNSHSQRQVRAALRCIVAAPDAELHFKYIINRCFYVIGSLWMLDVTRHGALRELIAQVERLPTSVPNDPIVRRLHRYLHAYVSSGLYLTLKCQMQLIEKEDIEPLQSEEDRPFGKDLKRFFFLYETVGTTKDIPPSYRNSIRQLQAQIAHDTRQGIMSYLSSHRQSTQQNPLPNPTFIPDAAIFQAIAAYRPDRPNSCRSEAQKFEEHYPSLRTLGELKREIRDYVLAPLIEVDNKYANNEFNHRFQKMLNGLNDDGFNDAMPNTDVTTTNLCRRILKHLVVDDIHHINETEFKGMICNVGHQAVTSVLLRVVMFWKRIRSCLEERFGILFQMHERDRQSDVGWLVQAFEHMNLALVLNAKWLGYPTV